MSVPRNIHNKIEEYLDRLDSALSNEDYNRSDIILHRLSSYVEFMNDEQEEYYNEAQGIVEGNLYDDEDYYEPSEIDEWHDYDPDC